MSDLPDPGGQKDTPPDQPREIPPTEAQSSAEPRVDAPAAPADIPSAPPPTPRDVQAASSPSSADLDLEVAQAMASMSPEDLAELSGGLVPDDKIEVGPDESVEPGTELTGVVAGVTDDEVFLEFGVKMQGVVPRAHFGKKEAIEPGRKVDVVVERYDDEAGMLFVSRKGEAQRATWLNLKPDMIVEGRVTGMNKGGLEVDLNGIRAFMPTSQVDVALIKDISVLLNEHVRAIVLEVDRRGKNVLISRRKMMEKELAESRERLLSELKVGQVRHGVVGNITDFGAFVNLGGIDGLVHVRDISWGQVEKVSDHLKPGQEVEVQVLRIDKKRDRISLGMKQIQPNPWDQVPEKYPPGTQLTVRILRLVDFGVFAELETGVEGLIPISEMGWTRVRRPSEVVAVGDMVDAVVIRIDPAKRRLALSMKEAMEDPWAGVLESFPAKSLVKGKVTRLTDFGAFVELVAGVEGLIHISEMSDRRIKSCSEVVEVGQEVETRVLGVDKENRRISLSIKAVAEVSPAEAAAQPAEAPRPPKKRKKKLRGGLSSHWDWGGDLKLDTDDVAGTE
jgi:small subunit ribosomal protein S1